MGGTYVHLYYANSRLVLIMYACIILSIISITASSMMIA